jgi:IS5 family transposase
MSKLLARSALKFDLFADAARKRKIESLGDPLQTIARHIDFGHLAQIIDALLPRGDTSKGGRPPYPTEVMVRILVLKSLYKLSDEQMEYQLLDRMSYQRFCLLADSANVPDRNTLWHYQQRLGVDGVTALFQAVDTQLLRHGYLAQCGQIIDATLVPAPIQHFTKEDKAQLAQGKTPADWSPSKRRQKDLDATHTKKHGKAYHGYKLSISVDVKHKFIRQIATGTASAHDSTHFDEVLNGQNTSGNVYADRGYPSKARSEMLQVLGYREHIQRKAKPGKSLSDCQKGRNKRIAKTRARVEHPFAQMRHMGGKLIRTIGQARATVAMTMMATCYNLKRLATFLEDGVDVFYKTHPSKSEMRLQGGNA